MPYCKAADWSAPLRSWHKDGQPSRRKCGRSDVMTGAYKAWYTRPITKVQVRSRSLDVYSLTRTRVQVMTSALSCSWLQSYLIGMVMG